MCILKIRILLLKRIFASIIITLTLAGSLFPQTCDNCSRPRIAMYDFAMRVPKPLDDSLMVKWLNLFWPGFSAKMMVRNNEPGQDCLVWYDGALLNAADFQNGTLRFGSEYTNLPPAGPISSADYILSGYIFALSGDNYESTLTLETAESRELVKAVSVSHKSDHQGVTDAASSLAAKFGSILKVIKDFERMKRNTDNEVAIRDLWTKDSPPEIKLTPAKQKVMTDESTDIKIEMVDCDGVPLGGRKIFFTDTTVNDMNFTGTKGGKIQPPVVVTDGSGRATVKFIAGKETGPVQITAFFPHRKPSGRAGGFMGSAAVLIGRPPSTKWVLHALISQQTLRTADTSWTGNNQNGIYKLYEKSEGTASITGLVKNDSGSDSSFHATYYEEYGYPMDNCTVSGLGSVNYFKKDYLAWDDPLPALDIESCLYHGKMESGRTGFEFHYPSEPGEIAVNAQCGGTAYGTSVWTHSVYFPERKIERESNNSSTAIDVAAAFLDGQCSVTKSDSAYKISGSMTTINKSRSPGKGTEITTQTYTLNAVLSSNGTLTDIKKEEGRVPSAFRLEQNYPNPFNPATAIRYHLPEAGNVSLKVYDVLGSEVETLVNSYQSAGSYRITFDAADLTSGIYFYKLNYKGRTYTRKMIVIK